MKKKVGKSMERMRGVTCRKRLPHRESAESMIIINI